MSTSTTMTTEQELQEMFARGNDHIARLGNVGASPRVFIISGPSGVGKDSVLECLKEKFPTARYVVTSTSREMRDGEEDGVHYTFLDRNELERAIDAGEYLEHASVYQKHLYGVPRLPILDGLANGQHVIIKVDVEGAETLRRKIKPSTSIFLAPESMEELYRRLKHRNTEDREALERRFRTAAHELDRAGDFDYIVFNRSEQLLTAVADIRRIIDAELQRISHPAVWVSSE